MKLGILTSASISSSRCALRNLIYRVNSATVCSTGAATTSAATESAGKDNLYRRISPLGDQKLSFIPVLEQWTEEGGTVKRDELLRIVKELRRYRRFKHALEISWWMSEKQGLVLSPGDVAIRLDLIGKVHGIEQAQSYFNSIPKELRAQEIYGALLNCFAHAKSVEKAEAIMQEMRDLGFCTSSLCYNVLLNLYYQTKNYGKLRSLSHEMEERGIAFDKFTLSIQLSAYAAASDVEGLEKIVKKMESDPDIVKDWSSYAVSANGFLRAGLVDRGLDMLKRCEKLILTSKERGPAYDLLLTEYAAAGKKDDVLRVWELYKKEKVSNKGYISVMTSLLKFNDVDNAERVFDDWESKKVIYDVRIPNLLLHAYCREGLLEKAEDITNRMISEGGKPNSVTWYYLGTGYIKSNQIGKAVEVLRKAVLACQEGWKPSKKTLSICIEYLKMKGDMQEAEDFITLLSGNKVISLEAQERLLKYLKSESNLLAEPDT